MRVFNTGLVFAGLLASIGTPMVEAKVDSDMAEDLSREIAEIASRQDYTIRVRTEKYGPLSAVAHSFNALLDGFAEREQKARVQSDHLKAAWDDVQTANMLLKRLRDELKARSQQLDQAVVRAAAASTAKSQFLANMSHEIRTPMNGILGTAELLARTQLLPKQKAYTDTIIRSGRALLTIINDVLDFSKVESGKLALDNRPFDLILCIDDVAAILTPGCARKNIKLSVEIEPDLPRQYVGDVGRVRQILTNIVGNSIKFTDAGEVKVILKGEVVDNRAELLIEVIDTGIGIPPERIADIFEEFSQVDNTASRRHEGTGLGLAICKSLIERMGGRIGLASTVGVGSTFWFILPLDVNQQASAPPHAHASLQGQCVMLVGADEAATDLREQLKRLGCKIDAVADCAGVAKALESPQAPAHTVVVLNSHASDDTLLRQASTLRSYAPPLKLSVVVCAAIGNRGDGKRFVEAGAQAYLIGELSDDQLRGAMQDAIANAARGLPLLVTRFSIGESRRQPEPAIVEAESTKPKGISGRNNVLLAEDSMVNREVAREFLESMGCTVECAKNGQEAVTKLNAGKFDIVLMDCQMPVMDGFQATRAIRERERKGLQRKIPIIALTANAFESDREKCLAAGMTDYLSKPFMPDQFESIIRKWLAAA